MSASRIVVRSVFGLGRRLRTRGPTDRGLDLNLTGVIERQRAGRLRDEQRDLARAQNDGLGPTVGQPLDDPSDPLPRRFSRLSQYQFLENDRIDQYDLSSLKYCFLC